MPIPTAPSQHNQSPEFQLLLATSWLAPEHLAADQAAQIASCCVRAIDWHAFISLARLHGVHPVVSTNLNRCGKGRVPAEILARLKDLSRNNTLNALRQAQELLQLVSRFQSQGIDIIPLKGQFLSHQLYGTIGMRCSSDLDILVHPDYLEETFRSLDRDGYVCCLHGTKLTPRQMRHIRTNLYHLEFIHESRNIYLELHWNLGSLWLPEQMALVWDHVTTNRWQNKEVRCLDQITQLLFLCDHGARHRFTYLKWLSDIARIIACLTDEEWTELLARSIPLDLRNTLVHTLFLVNWVYGVSIPDRAQDFMCNDESAYKLSRKIFGLLQLHSTSQASYSRRIGGLYCSWQVLRLRSSLSLFRTLRPSLIAAVDFHDFPLPDSLFWFYYPLRPLSWLWRYYATDKQ
jgi:hypothetical protein